MDSDPALGQRLQTWARPGQKGSKGHGTEFIDSSIRFGLGLNAEC